MIFGKGRTKGIRFNGAVPEVVTLGEGGAGEAECAVHDARTPGTGAEYLVAQLEPPAFPVPLGVFRAVEAPTYDGLNQDLARTARERMGRGSLDQLLRGGTTWAIGE
jgi:2-oxoglutarate ferredoxin oxidoreductase subunit beta